MHWYDCPDDDEDEKNEVSDAVISWLKSNDKDYNNGFDPFVLKVDCNEYLAWYLINFTPHLNNFLEQQEQYLPLTLVHPLRASLSCQPEFYDPFISIDGQFVKTEMLDGFWWIVANSAYERQGKRQASENLGLWVT